MQFFEVCTESERADILSVVQEGGWYAFFTVWGGWLPEVVMRCLAQGSIEKLLKDPKAKKYLDEELSKIAKKEKAKGSVPAEAGSVSSWWHNNDNMSVYKSMSSRGGWGTVRFGNYTLAVLADSADIVQVNSMWESQEGKVYPVRVPNPTKGKLRELGWDEPEK